MVYPVFVHHCHILCILKKITVFVCIVLLSIPVFAADSKQWIGTFNGIDAAEDQVLIIRQDQNNSTQYTITYSAISRPFIAVQEQNWLQGIVDVEGNRNIYRLYRESVGIRLVNLNVENVQTASTNAMYFVEEGTVLPLLPQNFMNEPDNTVRSIDAITFLESYPFWSPQGVQTGYQIIPENFKSVIKLYPYVQTDIAWKVCQQDNVARNNNGVAARLLRAQNVTCTHIIKQMKTIQRQNKFTTYKRTVDTQSKDAQNAIACARGEKMTDICSDITQTTSSYALNPQTIRVVLDNVISGK